jgi:hypothetical protein
MPRAGFKPAIPATKQPQTYALDCAATGIGSVDHDIRILGERNWRNSALDKEEWRKLLKKARAHAQLS